MPSSARAWTADEVRALPDDGNRYEVVDGELLVTPAPSMQHQVAVLEIAVVLRAYVAQHALGMVFISPADVAFGPRTMVQPDVFVTATAPAVRPRDWSELGPLLLAIEVVSPSSARRDRFTKRLLYQRQGIPEYWIVDLDARLVERWRQGDERPEVCFDRIEWSPASEHPPLVVDVHALFRDVLGE